MENQPSQNSRLIKTLLGALFVLFFTVQRHAGLNLVFVVLFLVPSFIHSAYVCFKRREERQVRLYKAGIWLMTIVVIVSSHAYMHNQAREVANAISSTIVLHRQTHGAYPASAEEAGLSREFMKKSRVFYNFSDGVPFLMYPVTFMPFDTYDFDFETGEWQYNGS